MQSKVDEFSIKSNGTIADLRASLDSAGGLQSLIKEQFNNRFELFCAAIGLEGLQEAWRLSEEGKSRAWKNAGDKEGASSLEITWNGSTLKVSVENGLFTTFKHALTFQDGPTTMYIENWLADNEAPKGMGFAVFRSIRRAAAELGAQNISLEASGTGGQTGNVGYYVWPRFGFDEQIVSIKGFAKTIPFAREYLPNIEEHPGDESPVATYDYAETRSAEWQEGAWLFEHDDEAELYEKLRDFVEENRSQRLLGIQWLVNDFDGETLTDMLLAAQRAGWIREVADFLRSFGRTIKTAVFDLTAGSKSQQVFENYVNEKAL